MIARTTVQEHIPPTPCLPGCTRHSAHSVLVGSRWQHTDDQHQTDSPAEGQSWHPSFAPRGFAERGSTFWRAQQHPRSSGPELEPWRPFWTLVGHTTHPDQCLASFHGTLSKGKHTWASYHCLNGVASTWMMAPLTRVFVRTSSLLEAL